jgi:hypothetical protein
MEIIINQNNFDMKNLFFSRCLSNKVVNNGKHISISYKIDNKLTLTNILLITPVMNIPFGIKKYNNYDDRQISKYYLDISFSGMENNKDIKQFYELINNFDTYIIDYLYKNQEKYFLDYNSKEELKNNYISQIRNSQNNSNANKCFPTFKLKLSKIKGENFSAEIYHKTKKINKIEQNTLKNTNVKCVIKCNGIWIIGKKIGITWKVEVINIISIIE